MLPSRKNEIFSRKNVSEDWDVLGNALPCPWAEIGILTALRANQIAGFVTVLSEKKINLWYFTTFNQGSVLFNFGGKSINIYILYIYIDIDIFSIKCVHCVTIGSPIGEAPGNKHTTSHAFLVFNLFLHLRSHAKLKKEDFKTYINTTALIKKFIFI